MRMYDIIQKKQEGNSLNEDELNFFITGVTDGSIPDYQISALLMAIFFRGMTDEETVMFTECIADSGEKADLSSIKGKKLDKHSTGGVGDKTSLIVAPMVAAVNKGVYVAKMSGRGLGHTGGTIDKLESIPGLKTEQCREDFIRIVNETGLCIIGQNCNFAPADKKLYALRDVTATVNCMPLIASSVMSKKLAAGSDCIVLDVKCGSGAFVKTLEEATKLAELMVKIGTGAGKKTIALITNMDIPLGRNVGNSLEVIEAIDVLNGNGDKNLTEICITLAANMLYAAKVASYDKCVEMVTQTLHDGSAKKKLADMVESMGGKSEYIYNPTLFGESKVSALLAAYRDGYIYEIDTELVGKAAAELGAGRVTKDSPIDYKAGIIFHKTVGDYIKEGEVLATIYTSKISKAQNGMELLFKAINISDNQPKVKNLIYKTFGGQV
ncbi:MAG: thymidine phosphorylase [Clostridiales bacterium GWF2_36_10]|nr:MAG: thymidine phosphorylase [Clostridiales bacterium GWF2_36_10]HAN21700.1 thymidine phosphorylase [Clostridiales bacterium]